MYYMCDIYEEKKMKRNADQIFNKYCKLLYKISIIMLCSEEDAYDAVQESFLKYLNTKRTLMTKAMKEHG